MGARTTHTAMMVAQRTPVANFATFDVEHMFETFDKDTSGGIDRDELTAALNKLGLATNSQQAAEVLARYDTDFSGVLELGEWTKLVRELLEWQSVQAKVQAQKDDEIARIFYTFDADSSGSIEHGELRAALCALGLPSSASDVERILRRYDADGNNRLDAEEFRNLVVDLRAYLSRS